MRDMASVFLWVVVLLLFPGRENASGLVIYRLGGEELPLPPEAGEQDVDFVQLGWLEVEEAQGGEIYQLDMDAQGIRALEYDPQVNIAPTAEDRGGKPILPALNGEVWDGDINTVWNATRYLCIEFRGTAGHQCREGFAQSGTTQIILGDGTMVLDRVRIEVHLSNGAELGPTPPVALAPGAVMAVNLPATPASFTGWVAHAEVGGGAEGMQTGGEHGSGGGRESGGEHGSGRESGGEHGSGGERRGRG